VRAHLAHYLLSDFTSVHKTVRDQTANFHAVRFYDSTDSLSRVVADFLGEGLRAGQPALVIAIPAHCAGIEAALRAQNLDVAALQESGQLRLLDAEETLATFMVDGLPDAERFHAMGIGMVQAVSAGRADCKIRAYGEMVDVLWKRGQSVAAVLLEIFWNKVAATVEQDVSVLCGYAMNNSYVGTQQQAICGQHTHVVGDDGTLVRAAATLH